MDALCLFQGVVLCTFSLFCACIYKRHHWRCSTANQLIRTHSVITHQRSGHCGPHLTTDSYSQMKGIVRYQKNIGIDPALVEVEIVVQECVCVCVV